jgi:outer membrane protein OmpA-like peptidoglycan-associated protein
MSRIGLLAGLCIAALGLVPGAGAAEIKVLNGVPTSDQWTEALKPQGAPGDLTFRGIIVNHPAGKKAAGASAPPVQHATAAAVSNQIRFAFDSADLTSETKSVLDTLGEAMNGPNLKDLHFEVQGHTDLTGSEAHNDELSRRRAESVANYLVDQKSVARDRLKTVGLGSSEPLDPTHGDSAVNRRVQIVTLDK